jgi:uncharacterized membrane protein YkgB
MFEINFVNRENKFKIKTGYKKRLTRGRRNQYTNTNTVFILTVTIPHWRFMIFNIDMICPIIQRQPFFISSFYFKFVFAVYEIIVLHVENTTRNPKRKGT